MLMEAPVFIVMLIMWWNSDRRFFPVELIFFLLFQLHYLQRAFIFPFLLKGNSRMPLVIMLMGITFNVLNGFMQGEWIFYLSPLTCYDTGWLFTPQFIIGTMLFFAGMVINLHSDYIIRHLRKPGDTKHYLPDKGMYRYVTSANYFSKGCKGSFHRIPIYSNTKLALTLFTLELAERVEDKGITVNAADPGIVSTNIITMHQWFDP